MSLLPDIATLLNNSIASSSTLGSPRVRSAMVFTSTLRQRALIARDELRSGITESSIGSVGLQEAQFLAGRPYVKPEITLGLNPNSVSFRQNKRITKKDTREGSVFFHFTNSRGSNDDILEIEFKINTGNIDRRGSLTTAQEEATLGQPTGTAVPSADDTGALGKLIAFHNMLLLAHEPNLLSDGIENTWFISYISPVFPRAVEFRGHFNEVPPFDELARKPNSRDYSFTFTVTGMSPPQDQLIDLVFLALQDAVLQPDSDAVILGANVRPTSP